MHYLDRNNVAELLQELSQYDVSVLNVRVLATCVAKIRTAVEELTFYPKHDIDTQADLIVLKEYQKIYDKEFEEVRGGKVIEPYDEFAKQLKIDPMAVENTLLAMDAETIGGMVIALASFPKKENPKYDDLRELCNEIMSEYISYIAYPMLLETISEYEKFVDEHNGLDGMLNLLYKRLTEFAVGNN